MRNLLFILAFLSICACGNLHKTAPIAPMSEREIKERESRLAIYDAKFIDSCTFIDQETWEPFPFEADLKKVIIVEYKTVNGYSDTYHFNLGDSLVSEVYSKVVDLNNEEVNQIKGIFQGFVNGTNSQTRCYEPRHCIYFVNDRNIILAYVEICFVCSQIRASHSDYFKIICSKQLTTLKYFFQSFGMTKFKW